MTPEQFRNIWTKNGDTLSPLPSDRLVGLRLLPETIDFLTIAGLPFDAAPFLSFVQDKDDSIRKLTNQFDFLGADYEKYLIIGTSGDGDVIVINSDNNDQIEWLDDGHVLYAGSQSSQSAVVDVYIAAIEGGEPARVFIPSAESPIVVR